MIVWNHTEGWKVRFFNNRNRTIFVDWYKLRANIRLQPNDVANTVSEGVFLLKAILGFLSTKAGTWWNTSIGTVKREGRRYISGTASNIPFSCWWKASRSGKSRNDTNLCRFSWFISWNLCQFRSLTRRLGHRTTYSNDLCARNGPRAHRNVRTCLLT